jgi:hypothetical protein
MAGSIVAWLFVVRYLRSRTKQNTPPQQIAVGSFQYHHQSWLLIIVSIEKDLSPIVPPTPVQTEPQQQNENQQDTQPSANDEPQPNIEDQDDEEELIISKPEKKKEDPLPPKIILPTIVKHECLMCGLFCSREDSVIFSGCNHAFCHYCIEPLAEKG